MTSSFRVVASASDSDGVRTMQIWLDGSNVFQVNSSKLDTTVSAGGGTHRATVQAYDGNYNKFNQTVYVTVSGTSSSSSSSSSTSVKTYSDIEEMSGWKSCTACAGGGGNAVYSMTQHIASPSLDGDAAKFSIGGDLLQRPGPGIEFGSCRTVRQARYTQSVTSARLTRRCQ